MLAVGARGSTWADATGDSAPAFGVAALLVGAGGVSGYGGGGALTDHRLICSWVFCCICHNLWWRGFILCTALRRLPGLDPVAGG